MLNNLLIRASFALPGQGDPVPPVEPELPGDLRDKLSTVLNVAAGVGLVVCALGIIVGGAMWGISVQRGQGGEGLGTVAKATAGAALIAVASSIINWFV